MICLRTYAAYICVCGSGEREDRGRERENNRYSNNATEHRHSAIISVVCNLSNTYKNYHKLFKRVRV